MPWMISYQYQAAFKYESGVRRNAPTEALYVFEETPGQVVLQHREALLALDDAKPKSPPERADDILCIYSAVEISQEEYDQLVELL